MNFDEVKRKALNKEIKLQDLEAEDILKFDTIGFLNPTLEKYFGLSKNEIGKIRKQKGITNAKRENYIRDIISLMDYNIKNTIMTFYEFKQLIIITFALTLHGFRPEKENNYDIIMNIDWENLDIQQEIKNKKIDVKFRLNELFTNMPQLKNLLDNYKKHQNIYNIEFANVSNKENNIVTKKLYVPNDKPLKYKSNVKRNSKISENALNSANYLCEIDFTHKTFIKKVNGKRYMEPHHLIPLEFQEYFKYSLDVEANIISLCSYCHDEIHHGINNTELIKKLYYERIELLNEAGIYIDFNTLLLFYEYKRKQLENIINIEEHISQNN